MYVDEGLRQIKDAEVPHVRHAPIEIYVNTYLERAVAVYKISPGGLSLVRCNRYETFDLEKMICEKEGALSAYGVKVL